MTSKQKFFLKPEAILKYLKGDEKLQEIVLFKPEDVDLVTSDQNLYEALASVEDRSQINLNLLVKLLELVTIQPHMELIKVPRHPITHEEAEELRGKAK
ncbi:MAG: hypothetical protein HGA85_04990 [Nanoarchaeota archaeon]|nr:hypothetical protein [Nanoarchaeota archaeon]